MVRAMPCSQPYAADRHPVRTLESEHSMLAQLFPERIFSRKLDPSADKRLRLAQARAEESIVQAHVENALMFVDNLAEDLPFDRAIETYVRVMGIPEPLASTVVTRTTAATRKARDRKRRVARRFASTTHPTRACGRFAALEPSGRTTCPASRSNP